MWVLNVSFLLLCAVKLSYGNNTSLIKHLSTFASNDQFIKHIENATKIENIVSTKCRTELIYYLKALSELKLWALLMYDSKSKLPPSGLLSGNLIDLGEFDQCLKIKNSYSEGVIYGKYCLGTIPITLPKEKKSVKPDRIFFGTPEERIATSTNSFLAAFATCVPNSCSTSDIQSLYSGTGITIEFFDEFCQSKISKPELTGGDIATITFLSVILCIMVISTLYDILLFYFEKKPLHPLLTAFSVLTNGKKLIATSNGSGQISCLHGIRVISMMWIILSHRFGVMSALPKKNFMSQRDWFADKKNMFIMGATVSVDTFFVLSGLLVAYIFMTAMAKGAKFNIILYYVHRYLRLTPVFAVIILIHVTILRHLGSGPLWYIYVSNLSKGCKEYWWSSLLYVHNYVNQDNTCVSQSWYLAVDTQLYLLSPILLIALKKRPFVGLSLTTVCLLASILCSFLVAWFTEIYGFLPANRDEKSSYNFHMYYYVATHTRAGPWLMGIMLGYYIYDTKQKRKNVAINKMLAFLLWIITMTLLFVCVFTGHNTTSSTYEYNKIANSFYVALMRPGWALGLCWVIFACVTGYGGSVNWFLSLPMFQVLSKLTYGMYLIHNVMQVIVSGQLRSSVVFSTLDTLFIFWGDFAFSLATALIFTLAFESPVIVIEKVIFGNKEKKGPQSDKQLETADNLQTA